MGNILLFFGLLAFAAIVFIGIGAWAFTRSKPMHFWSGTAVSPSEIRDIKGYNHANGIMWMAFGGLMLAVGALCFYNTGAAAVATAVGYVGGLPVLVLVYHRIYNKYKA